MTKSTNLQMNKPEYSDQYDLQHWNENTDILDNAYNSIVNTGDTVVKKAQQDESGNNIKSTYATKSELNDAKSEINTSLGQKEVTANKVSAWQSTPDNTHYPTEKLVKDNLDNKSNVGHTHNISDVTNLQSSLNGKANSSHTHTKNQITDFPSSMPASDVYSWAKSSSKPSYSISEISGLQNALDGIQNSLLNKQSITFQLASTISKTVDMGRGSNSRKPYSFDITLPSIAVGEKWKFPFSLQGQHGSGTTYSDESVIRIFLPAGGKYFTQAILSYETINWASGKYPTAIVRSSSVSTDGTDAGGIEIYRITEPANTDRVETYDPIGLKVTGSVTLQRLS